MEWGEYSGVGCSPSGNISTKEEVSSIENGSNSILWKVTIPLKGTSKNCSSELEAKRGICFFWLVNGNASSSIP